MATTYPAEIRNVVYAGNPKGVLSNIGAPGLVSDAVTKVNNVVTDIQRTITYEYTLMEYINNARDVLERGGYNIKVGVDPIKFIGKRLKNGYITEIVQLKKI